MKSSKEQLKQKSQSPERTKSKQAEPAAIKTPQLKQHERLGSPKKDGRADSKSKMNKTAGKGESKALKKDLDARKEDSMDGRQVENFLTKHMKSEAKPKDKKDKVRVIQGIEKGEEILENTDDEKIKTKDKALLKVIIQNTVEPKGGIDQKELTQQEMDELDKCSIKSEYEMISDIFEYQELMKRANFGIKRYKNQTYKGLLNPTTGKRHGFGVLINDGGRVYEGQWADDKRSG